MERLKRDSLIVSLIGSLKGKGSWCGETHVQKTAYFLQELLGVPLEFDFILYKHGPYSFDLSAALTQMRADGTVKLIPQWPYGPSLEPDTTSELLKKLYPKTIKKYDPQIQFTADKLGKKNVAELERLGTALYVTLDAPTVTKPGIRAKRIHKLKPHVPLDKALEAVNELDSIREAAESVRS
ncbi:MAG: hypothetical protein ACRD2P_15535 [Terriglobia bacterium]